MAVLRPSPPLLLLLLLTLTSLILQPSHSLNCSSQTFKNNKIYSNCTDLPTLNSTLHWTFAPQNSTLAVAFAAPPATPDGGGWIAWGINPTATGMVGCQTLIAFKNPNGSMTVKTYDITSYKSVEEGKISLEVPESSAEFSGGVMRIFATVRLPETMTEVNHVWQVGGSVMDGAPMKHAFSPENLKAVGRLQLATDGKVSSNATGIATGNGTAGSPVVAPSTGGSSGATGSYGIVMFFVCLLAFS